MSLVHSPAAMSEFVAGLNGDCGETAELVALHALSPAFALTAVALGALDRREISAKAASSNGAEPLAAIANDLTALGCTIINYGYSEPYNTNWRALLADHGGIHPCILEVADAEADGGDEPGVHYHFFTQLDRGLYADGDNAACFGGNPVAYSDQEIADKRICGLIVLLSVPGQYPAWRTADVYTQRTSDGWWVDSNTGHAMGDGAYQFAIRQPWWAHQPLLMDEAPLPNSVNHVICLGALSAASDQTMVWRNDLSPHQAMMGLDGHAIVDYANAVASLQAQLTSQADEIAQLKAQLAQAQATPPPPPTPTPPTPAETAYAQAVTALAAALAYAQAAH